MRTKRFLSLLLAGAMTGAAALTLSSCKESEESSETPVTSKYDVAGTWYAEIEAPGTVGGGGQMTYDHQVTACKFNNDGTGTWYRFMLTNDSGNPIALDGGAGQGDFTYSVGADGQIACRLTGSKAPAYYPKSLALTVGNDTISGVEGDVAYKMSRASDIMARWITDWDQRLHGGGNSDETTGDIVDLSTLTGDMEARNGQTLTGTLGCYVKVSIADGATVTLSDATINGRNKNAFRWAGITCPGNATLVLEGENSVRGFQRMFPGIHIAPGKTLTVSGSGSLSAGSNGYGAGIGGGSSIDCGHIVIEGGTISAEGGSEAAAIGGGGYAACGNITITDDVTSLTAIKGDGAKHSIGAGADGSCGKVTVGGKEGAVSASPFIFPVVVTGVTLSQTEAMLAVGETVTLTATVIPDYAADKVTWSSSDEAVATVKDGVVTAKGEGTATITVSSVDGTQSATCAVTVYIPVTGVSLSQTSATLLFGETLALTATVAPANATNKSVTWSSSNQDVATVNESGVVTAKAEGTATITATTVVGKKTATCKVTVNSPVTGVSLSQTSAMLEVGETLTLTATVTPATAPNKSVTWTSSNPAAATVADGVVTAKAAGMATITATTVVGKKTATCKITVNDVLVTGVSLSQTSAAIEVGETLKLTATIAPANATYKGVTWSSSNTAVATVADGVVTGKTAGMTTIKVTTVDGKKTATCKVTVNDDESDEFLVDLSMLTEDYTAYDGDILTGTLGKNVKISIASGATVTLRDVTINGVDNAAYRWAGITCRGNATIILEGTNSVRGFQGDYPGIHIPKGKTLTIKGSGTLNASAYAYGWGGAGIGGGSHIDCGNIVIEGGTVNAGGGNNAPGIGSGGFAACGNITITSGVTSVTATKGSGAPYSIGPGKGGSCGTVTIGGKTGAIGESPYTYKP